MALSPLLGVVAADYVRDRQIVQWHYPLFRGQNILVPTGDYITGLESFWVFLVVYSGRLLVADVGSHIWSRVWSHVWSHVRSHVRSHVTCWILGFPTVTCLSHVRSKLHILLSLCIGANVVRYTVTSTSPWRRLPTLELLIRSLLRLRVYSVIELPK